MFTKSQKSFFFKDELFLKEIAQTESHVRFALIILFHPIYEYI